MVKQKDEDVEVLKVCVLFPFNGSEAFLVFPWTVQP